MTEPRPDAITTTDALAIVLIIAVWFAASLAVGPTGDFPLNDDWIYGRAVKALLAGDGILLPGAVRGPTIANLVTQALWGAAVSLPAGFSYTALRFSTLVIGATGLGFFFALLRENGAGRPMAGTATLALSVNIFYLGLAHSFMTDVPYTALLIIALYFLIRALRQDSTTSLLIGLVVSFAIVLQKQLGLVPSAAYAVACALKHRFHPRATLLGFLPLVLGITLHLGFQMWLLHSGRGFFWISWVLPWDPISLAVWTLQVTIYSVPYLGLMVFPVIAMTGILPAPTRSARAAYTLAVVAGAAAMAVLWWKHDVIPYLINVLTPFGLGPFTQRDTYLLRQNLPRVSPALTVFWLLINACGMAGFIALATIGIASPLARFRRGEFGRADWAWVMAAAAAITYFVAIVLLSTQTAEYFDRYVLPLTPLALIMLTTGSKRGVPAPIPAWRIIATAAILVVSGGLSIAATHDYLAWNRARWAAVSHLTADLGVPPSQIDGGYEVNGSLMYQPGFHSAPGKSWWWVQDDRYILASGPLSGYHEIMSYPVTSKYLPVGLQQVLILERND
jgi:hypothetical protein